MNSMGGGGGGEAIRTAKSGGRPSEAARVAPPHGHAELRMALEADGEIKTRSCL